MGILKTCTDTCEEVELLLRDKKCNGKGPPKQAMVRCVDMGTWYLGLLRWCLVLLLSLSKKHRSCVPRNRWDRDIAATIDLDGALELLATGTFASTSLVPWQSPLAETPRRDHSRQLHHPPSSAAPIVALPPPGPARAPWANEPTLVDLQCVPGSSSRACAQ